MRAILLSEAAADPANRMSPRSAEQRTKPRMESIVSSREHDGFAGAKCEPVHRSMAKLTMSAYRMQYAILAAKREPRSKRPAQRYRVRCSRRIGKQRTL